MVRVRKEKEQSSHSSDRKAAILAEIEKKINKIKELGGLIATVWPHIKNSPLEESGTSETNNQILATLIQTICHNYRTVLTFSLDPEKMKQSRNPIEKDLLYRTIMGGIQDADDWHSFQKQVRLYAALVNLRDYPQSLFLGKNIIDAMTHYVKKYSFDGVKESVIPLTKSFNTLMIEYADYLKLRCDLLRVDIANYAHPDFHDIMALPTMTPVPVYG